MSLNPEQIISAASSLTVELEADLGGLMLLNIQHGLTVSRHLT